MHTVNPKALYQETTDLMNHFANKKIELLHLLASETDPTIVLSIGRSIEIVTNCYNTWRGCRADFVKRYDTK